MRILGFRTVAILYPYLSLEMKIETKDQKIIYANISVNEDKEEIEVVDDFIEGWFYDCPLDENDDVDKHHTSLSEEEKKSIFMIMVDFWNYYLTFDNDKEWKHAECAYGCASLGYLCNGNPYTTRCGGWEIEKGCVD